MLVNKKNLCVALCLLPIQATWSDERLGCQDSPRAALGHVESHHSKADYVLAEICDAACNGTLHQHEVILDHTGKWKLPAGFDLVGHLNPPKQDFSWMNGHDSEFFSGSQTIVMRSALGGGSSGDQTFIIDLLDLTPPSLHVFPVTSGDMLTMPSGVPYVVSPDVVTLDIQASDAVDPYPGVSVMTNGEEIDAGTEFSQIGLHVVSVWATDWAGNLSEKTVAFEIRPRPVLPAISMASVIDEIWQGDQLLGIEMEILLGSDAFDPYDLHLGLIQGHFLSGSGDLVGESFPMQGIELCEGDGEVIPEIRFRYSSSNFQSWYEYKVWSLRFEVDLSGLLVSEMPTQIMLTGRSSEIRSGNDFEFATVSDLVVEPQPWIAMSTLVPEAVDWTIGPRNPPGSDDDGPAQCEWKWLFSPDADLDEDVQDEACQGPSVWQSRPLKASAHVADFWTGFPEADVRAEDWGCHGSAAAAAVAHTNASMVMFLQPLPSCTKCIMDECARPIFNVSASTTDRASAEAYVYAFIDVTGKSISVRTEGGLAIGSITNQTTINIANDGWDFPITIDPSRDIDKDVFGVGPIVCEDFSGCSTVVQITSKVKGSGAANCMFGPVFPQGEEGWMGSAAISQAKLFGASPRLTVTGTVVEGPCSGLTDTFSH
jgi:hypothetical protein